MEEKCFCHITDKDGNTYVVKDKEAREAIARMGTLYQHNLTVYRPVTTSKSDVEKPGIRFSLRVYRKHSAPITTLESVQGELQYAHIDWFDNYDVNTPYMQIPISMHVDSDNYIVIKYARNYSESASITTDTAYIPLYDNEFEINDHITEV